jgi:protein O-GlcNAc transferase
VATLSEALIEAVKHQQAGRLDMAEDIYRQILAVIPDQPDTLDLMGVLACRRGNYEQGIEFARQAIALNDGEPCFHFNLADACRNLGRTSEAVASYRRAIELKPDFDHALNNLGVTFRARGEFDEAVACFRRVLEIRPGSVEAHNSLGNTLRDLGNPDEAAACYRRALHLDPSFAMAHSNLLCALAYQDGATLADLLAAHRDYERRHAAPLHSVRLPHANVRDPDRRLRLGFLSPDFYRHPVGCFAISVLESLDRQQCETICYHSLAYSDDMTNRFQVAASTWRSVHALSDEQLETQIRADQIDILFDLAGHTGGNRMLLFARKPAPIQVEWIGYEGTTGLSAMDYIVADRHVLPAEDEPYYLERVLCMPDGYLCYAPPSDAPPVGPLPAVGNGHVTFASYSNLAKIGPRVVRVWAEILRRVPRSQLILKYRGLDNESAQRRFSSLFAANGVEPGRVQLLPPSPIADYLASYNQVDLALDPFPFSGSATSCDALWMGVPVITCPGQTFASRHGLTHLSNLQLADSFVARDHAHYVDLAVRWANDVESLAEIRASLRQRMAASPLCNAPQFAANLMALLRQAWRRWCEGAA